MRRRRKNKVLAAAGGWGTGECRHTAGERQNGYVHERHNTALSHPTGTVLHSATHRGVGRGARAVALPPKGEVAFTTVPYCEKAFGVVGRLDIDEHRRIAWSGQNGTGQVLE